MNKQNPVVRVLMLILASIFVAPIELAKWLARKSYDTNHIFMSEILGIVTSLVASFEAGKFMSHSHSWYAWLPCAIATGLASFWYLYPIAYLLVIKHVVDFTDYLTRKVHTLIRTYAQKVESQALKFISKLPMSSNLWTRESSLENGWFIGLLNVLNFIFLTLLGGIAGYKTYTAILTSLANLGPIGTVASSWAAIVAGCLVGVTAIVIFVEILLNTDRKMVAFITGGIIAKASFSFFSFSLAQNLALSTVVFFVWVAYIFPLIAIILGNGFWKRVWQYWKPVVDGTYNNFYYNNIPSAVELFWQVSSIIAGVLLAMFVNSIFASMSFGMVGIALAAFAGLGLYYTVTTYSTNDAGNFPLGLFFSLYASIKCAIFAHNANLYGGIATDVALGIVTMVASMIIIYPAIFTIFTKVAGKKAFAGVTNLALKAVKAITFIFVTLMRNTYKAASHIFDYCYNARKPFDTLFAQMVNIGLAILVFELVRLNTSASLLHTVLGYIAATLSYLLVGKAIVHKYGVSVIGVCTGIASAVGVGVKLYKQVALIKVLVGAAIVFNLTTFVVFPLVYIAVRAIATPVLMPWLLKVLEAVFNFAWSYFNVFWQMFLKAYRVAKAVFDAIFKPVIKFMAMAWAQLKAVWNSIFKHQS